ncbi:GGDEF domain-containing protein [Lysinibacillus piscis]|uniref:GGDEF domain-containing protein n=1 Tax=Lysinibacillus piscis TaxID=2518931 RepID=A0ABQ5NKN3_9BACI|nr:GGDEF domain-containing protein [Lysinibacillus sp. KH24]GLC88641.1 hypothetical protein LYSBPC_17680 [Lysinibacillus sp. KH24]
MLIASVIILLVIRKIEVIQNEEKKYRLAHYTMFGYYLFVLLWGVSVTLFDQLSYGHVTVYLTNLFLTSTLFIASRRTTFVLHIIPIITLLTGFIYLVPTGKALSGHIINISFFWIFAILLTNTLLTQMEKIFKQRLLLNEQNEQLRLLNHNLEFYANRDPLTQLANRYHLETYLNEKLREKQTVSIFIFDIDSFKSYNDFYGHPQGDKVLQAIGHALHHLATKNQLFACRLGGEEFLLIGFQLTVEQTAEIAEEIRATVAELQIPHEKSPTKPYVTASLGYIQAKIETMQQFDEYVQLADEALYTAKHNGRNQVYGSAQILV